MVVSFMRFAARGKAKFMQMEVGMAILPCGGGASRMVRQVGLGKALEIILGAKDWDALKEEAYQLFQATSKTPAIKRFTIADENGAQFDHDNQKNWENMLIDLQEIK